MTTTQYLQLSDRLMTGQFLPVQWSPSRRRMPENALCIRRARGSIRLPWVEVIIVDSLQSFGPWGKFSPDPITKIRRKGFFICAFVMFFLCDCPVLVNGKRQSARNVVTHQICWVALGETPFDIGRRWFVSSTRSSATEEIRRLCPHTPFDVLFIVVCNEEPAQTCMSFLMRGNSTIGVIHWPNSLTNLGLTVHLLTKGMILNVSTMLTLIQKEWTA